MTEPVFPAPGSAPDRTGWFKSSHSATNAHCVEVRFSSTGIGVRDSKNPVPVLSFSRDAWTAFLATLAHPTS